MRILYQPTQGNPTGWKQVDSSAWAGLNSFTCHALCIQGVTIDGFDHYSVEPIEPGVVRAVVWNDDEDDWPEGQKWAREIYFRHLAPDADPRFGGAINTNQTQVIYAQAGIKPILEAAYSGNSRIEIKDWTDFDTNRANPMQGQWVTDAQHAAHQDKQSVEGWRTWTEGIDPAELDAQGRVRVQRARGRYERPKGTRTYYHNATDLSIPAYTAANSNALAATPAGATTEDSGNVGGTGALVWAAATPSNEPDSSAWPTTGTYRYQIDCVAAGVDLTFGLLTQGTGNNGGFARLNAALDTELQLFTQSQSAFSGSGLHLATVTDPAWSSGSSTDRFAVKVAAIRVSGHGNQTMNLQVGESDDFADGPWAAAPAAVADNSVLFGTNF